MTENKRFTIEYVQGSPTIFHIVDGGKHIDEIEIVDLLNGLSDENEQLKQQLKEFEDYVYSDEKILCYTCVNCISKGIYEVECSEKGKVDVHGSCFMYWENELKGDDE